MDLRTEQRAARIFRAVDGLEPRARAARLREVEAEDPELAAAVAELLAHADRPLEHLDRSLVPERPSVPSLVGRRIAGFRLVEVLARGGMGTVYLAEQEHPERRVAVKVLNPGLASESAVARFENEARLLALVRHPGIAHVYESGTFEGDGGPVPYTAMEYVPGALPITEFVDRADLGLRGRIDLFVRVCDAVHVAHQKSVVHRDLKPSNVLVDDEGNPKVIDFGIARALDCDLGPEPVRTRTGDLVGTVRYMSPEQCAGDREAIDTRSDVYALGVLLHELLTGRPPHAVDDVPLLEAVDRIRRAPLRRPSETDPRLRGDLDTILLKALEKDPDRRYGSVRALADDLGRHLRREPIHAHPPSALYELGRFARRNRGLVGAATIATLALVTVSAAASWSAVEARSARDDAEREARLKGAVHEFMHEALTSARPNEDTTLREFLDAASGDVADAYDGEPLVEAEVRDMIAWMYGELGLYDDSERHYAATLALRESALGPEAPPAVEARQSYARALEHAGKGARATALYRDVLAAREAAFHDGHAEVLEARNNLALHLLGRGELAEAEDLLRGVVELRERRGEEGSEDHITNLNNLALVLTHSGQKAEALALERRVVAYEEQRDPDGEHALIARSNLAWDLLDSEPAEAVEHFRHVLAGMRELKGEDHPYAFIATHALATGLVRVGEVEEAVALYMDAIGLATDALGETSNDRLALMSNLAVVLQNHGRLAEAGPLLREVVEVRRATLGEREYDTILAIHNLGWQLWKEGDAAAGEELLREALALWEAHAPRDLGSAAGTRASLVELLEEQGRADEAAAVRAVAERGR